MANIAEKVINGVSTISLHGKNYVQVAERVRLVHEQKREFEVIESLPLAFGDRCIWRVTIKVDGRVYIGNAEAKMNAPKGTPDGSNPFECAETSAIGRALAFAGLGSVESIASFDEVVRAITSASPQEAKATPPKSSPEAKLAAQPAPPSMTQSDQQRSVSDLLTSYKTAFPAFCKSGGWGKPVIRKALNLDADADIPDLTPDDVLRLEYYIKDEIKAKQQKAS